MIITKHLHQITLKPIHPQTITQKILTYFSAIDKAQQIHNNNLSFDANDWMINLYPFYPELRKKRNNNCYQISNGKPVLALVFLDKTMEFNKAWALRKAFTFSFDDCCLFSSLRIGSGKQYSFQSVTQAKYTHIDMKKKLIIADNPAQSSIIFNFIQQPFQKTTATTSKPPKKKKTQIDPIKIDLPYDEYRIMQKLISNSLFELGGWAIKYDVARKEHFDRMEMKGEQDKVMDEIFQEKFTL